VDITAEYIAQYPFGELCEWDTGDLLRSATWDEYCLSIERRVWEGNVLKENGKIYVRGIPCFVWTADQEAT